MNFSMERLMKFGCINGPYPLMKSNCWQKMGSELIVMPMISGRRDSTNGGSTGRVILWRLKDEIPKEAKIITVTSIR
jgi:hypothetical protein